MSDSKTPEPSVATEKEVFEELEHLDNEGQTKVEKEVRETAIKYCKNEWSFGGRFLVHATLVHLGIIDDDQEIPEDVIKAVKQKHFEQKLITVAKGEDNKNKFAY